MLYPECLNELIESFKKIPGIGEKTALSTDGFFQLQKDEASTENQPNVHKNFWKTKLSFCCGYCW